MQAIECCKKLMAKKPLNRMRGALPGAVALTLALVALSGTALAQNDRVILKNGKDKQVRIKSEDLEGVWFTNPGQATDTVIQWNEIDSIQYSRADAYQKAIETLAQGRTVEAAGLLAALAGDEELRPVLKQSVLFHLAVADMRAGKSDDALARYKELLANFPKSRYLLSIGSSLLSIHLSKNDVAGAATALEPIFAAAKDAKPDVQASFSILRGRLLEEQKKLDEAASMYDGIIRNAKADPDVMNGAKLGLARLAHKRNQTNDAEQRYRELTKADAPNILLAGAWNGLGDLALEQGVAKRDPDGLRLALLSYLRGVVQYVPAQGEPTDELERALAGAARSSKAIGELESNAERKQAFLDRSRQHRAQLEAQFPGSRFLPK